MAEQKPIITFTGLGYPEFQILTCNGDVTYRIRSSAETDWQAVTREAYLDILETSKARDAAATVCHLDRLADAVRDRS